MAISLEFLEARQRYLAQQKRMAQIDANSPELKYRQKLRWLSATGQADEMKRMIEERNCDE